jgi:hypothetical protein
LTANIVAIYGCVCKLFFTGRAQAQSCDFLRERTPIAPRRMGHHARLQGNM